MSTAGEYLEVVAEMVETMASLDALLGRARQGLDFMDRWKVGVGENSPFTDSKQDMLRAAASGFSEASWPRFEEIVRLALECSDLRQRLDLLFKGLPPQQRAGVKALGAFMFDEDRPGFASDGPTIAG